MKHNTHILYLNYVLIPKKKSNDCILEQTTDSRKHTIRLSDRITLNQLMDSCEALLACGAIESYAIHPINELPTIV